jgi:hypothetical protein
MRSPALPGVDEHSAQAQVARMGRAQEIARSLLPRARAALLANLGLKVLALLLAALAYAAAHRVSPPEPTPECPRSQTPP